MTAIFYSLVFWSWHALLLLGCAWLLCRLSGPQPAWIRHHIWLFALLAVVLLPLWTGIASQLQIQQLHGAEGFASFVNLPETLVSFSRVEPLSTQAAINSSLPEKQQVFDWSFYFPSLLLVFWVCGAGVTA